MAVNARRLNLDPPLSGRNGRKLRALLVARISTEQQDALSLDDQLALLEGWVREHTDLPITIKTITSRGSGERLDRREFRRLNRYVRKRRIDLVISEDLGRIVRRVHGHLFCELCEDQGVRLIAVNDFIDTFKEDWRDQSFFATYRHERYNRETAKRIRRTLRNRFSQGGVFQTTIYGYLKPADAKSDADVRKDPKAEAVYDEWFARLENGESYQEVADWLNQSGVPVGAYCRSDKWDCKMVSRVTCNPLLKGVRLRNKKKARRINKSGRSESIDAPADELLTRNCPHLAFVEPLRYDRVLRLLAERNGKYKPGADGTDPRKGRPKKRTIWPGQHIYCDICRGLYRYGGHGQTEHLMCRGAYEYRCWNGVTVDGPKAAAKLTSAILAEVESLPPFSEDLTNLVNEELLRRTSSRTERLDALRRDEEEVLNQISNIVAFVRTTKGSQALVEELERLETRKSAFAEKRREILEEPDHHFALPSVEEVKLAAREALRRQGDEPYEFGRCMRRLIHKIVVRPYRLCDGGGVVLRAQFMLNLAGLIPPSQRHLAVKAHLQRELTVDLFDLPQRAEFREDISRLRKEMTLKDAAAQLGITAAAAGRAAALDLLMAQESLTDPYVAVLEPPADITKLRRHLHPRYKLQPFPA